MVSAAIHVGLPFADYAKSPEAHATALRYLLVSPLAYLRAIENQCDETDAMRFGRAVHTACLEPDRFLVDYVLWDGGARRGKAWDSFCAASATKTILTAAQYNQALRVRDAVRNHPIAGKYLADKGQAELSIRWIHERTGIAIKCRLDYVSSVLVDLKSTRDPSPRRFAASAAQFGYDLQMALYADGAAAAGLGVLPVKLIAVQTVEPLDVVVYSLSEEFLAAGRDKYERSLDLLVECERTNAWPGIAANEEIELRLPAWAMPEAEEEITFGGEPVF